MTWKLSILLALLGLFLGCGTEREQTTTTKTVETVETVTGPIIADVPMVGQVVIQPVRHVYRRTLDTVKQETEVKTLQLPDVGPILTAASAGVPGLGIAGGILGLITATAAGWKAMSWRRQRNELIDGVEASKTKLPPEAWGTLTTELSKSQNGDTKAVVKGRTS